ncbi:hypothetical protein [Pseudomonas sp.]|uniref:hypothetical protein n=1 Tax=Pseudomonas sp. TaxID=306 RepID=UPI00260C86D0|nr:hypothetical protein [Pseudomonas sp.]
MSFHLTRRQQFLSEKYYKLATKVHNQIIDDDDGLEASLASSKTEPKERIFFAQGIATDKFNLLMLDYTAGVSADILQKKSEELLPITSVMQTSFGNIMRTTTNLHLI